MDSQRFYYMATNDKITIFMNHFSSKYNLPKLFSMTDIRNTFKNPLDDSCLASWYINSYNLRQLYVPHYYKHIVRRFVNNTTQRFLAFPIILKNANSITYPAVTQQSCGILNSQSSHIIMIVYDKQFGYLEHFDSTNNYYHYDAYLLNTVIVNILTNAWGLSIKGIYTPFMISPAEGIQCIQEKEVYSQSKEIVRPMFGVNIGFCSIYAFWYLNIRMKMTNVSPQECYLYNLNKCIRESNDSNCLTSMIVEYTKHLMQKYNEIVSNIN